MQLDALNRIGRKIFGSKNDRELKRLQPLVKLIGDFEPALEAESDDNLRARIAATRGPPAIT
jgi:preprotein translocase subunit SecA